MAVDALAHCIARISATIVLTYQDKQVLVFTDEEFQLPAPSKFCEIIKNADIFFVSQNRFSMERVKTF